MNSAIVKAANFMFDVKNIQESALPSKIGAVRLLAVSALVASVATCILLPAVAAPALVLAAVCTGIIVTSTALKNRQIKQLNESDLARNLNEINIVNNLKDSIKEYSKEKKYSFLAVCLGYLNQKKESMPETIHRRFWQSPLDINEYIEKGLQDCKEKVDKDLVEIKEEIGQEEKTISITSPEIQKEIEGLSNFSILSIMESLYRGLGKQEKTKQTQDLLKKISQNNTRILS